ncbi:MAG TPA: AAA family ATPase, partial [Isosphaeraceae bacterium]
MKVVRLDLRAFGPFTDVALDFPADGPGLNLIHGPNEAGKSTALRALLCLLFGFPHQKEDDFLHEAKRQRVGATLRSAAGDELTVVRRRGRLKDLRGGDDETIVDASELSRHLAGVDRDRFNRLYLCGLDKLISGGEAVLKGEGDFGAILFGGAGLEGISQVLRELRTTAEVLFKPGANATIPAINAGLRSLEQKRREAVQFSLPTEEWRRLRGEHDEAVRLRDATKTEHDRIEAEHRRLVRIGDALPLFARLAKDRADLANLGPVPDLPEDFSERHVRAVAGRDEAARRIESLRTDIKALHREHDAIEVHASFLAEAEAIERLRDGRDARRKGYVERPALVRRIARPRTAARALLAEVAPGRRLPEARSIQPSKAQKAAIRKLGLDRATAFEAVRAAREAIDAIDARRAATPPLPEGRVIVEDLAGLVERIKARGDLDAAVASATAKLRKAEQRAEQSLARLPGWSGTLDDLRAAPLPSAETIARFDRDFREAENVVLEIERDRKKLAAELAEIDEKLEAARLAGELPTLHDLRRARTERDAAWDRIARAWLASVPLDEPRKLAGEYEGHVVKADAVADRLRLEADRVATLAALQTKRKASADRAEALHETEAAAAARAARLGEAWADFWRPAGVAPLPPAEMREWLARRDALLVEAEGVGQARDEAAAARTRREESIGEISALLGALDEPAPCPSDSAMAWIGRAEGV